MRVFKALWAPWCLKIQYSFGLSRELVLAALPRLMKLDAQLISSWRDPDPAEEEGASDDSDYEEDDDIPELTGPFCADKGDQAAAVSHLRPQGQILPLIRMSKSRQSHLLLDLQRHDNRVGLCA